MSDHFLEVCIRVVLSLLALVLLVLVLALLVSDVAVNLQCMAGLIIYGLWLAAHYANGED